MKRRPFRILNGYKVLYLPEHHSAMSSSNWNGYVYEHIVVAEIFLKRNLIKGEVVHHKDRDRANNARDNLIVFSSAEDHGRYHALKGKGTLVLLDSGAYKFVVDVVCKLCKLNFNYVSGKVYCSSKCAHKALRRANRPSRELLQHLIWVYPTSTLALRFKVSDTAIAKWCRSYDIKKPGRGWWTTYKTKITGM